MPFLQFEYFKSELLVKKDVFSKGSVPGVEFWDDSIICPDDMERSYGGNR